MKRYCMFPLAPTPTYTSKVYVITDIVRGIRCMSHLTRLL